MEKRRSNRKNRKRRWRRVDNEGRRRIRGTGKGRIRRNKE